jgi:hypothetical protein
VSTDKEDFLQTLIMTAVYGNRGYLKVEAFNHIGIPAVDEDTLDIEEILEHIPRSRVCIWHV